MYSYILKSVKLVVDLRLQINSMQIRIIISFVFLLLVGTVTHAQDQLGMKLSNMAPTQMARLNPSAIVDQKPFRDFEIFGVGAYLMNDYIYYDGNQTSILTGQIPEEPDDIYNTTSKNVFAQANVFLPSFSTSYGKYAFGLRTNIRTFAHGKDIPFHLAKFFKEGIGFDDLQDQELFSSNFRVNATSWLEIGGQFGMILLQKRKHMLTGGISLQRLSGIAGAGLYASTFNYNVENDTVFTILETTSDFGVSNLGFNAGRGWGTDIGFTYHRKLDNTERYNSHSLKSGCNYIDYKWKAGISLIDLGRINFTPNSFYRGFQAVGAQLNNLEGQDPQSVEDLVSYIDDGILVGDVDEDNEFRMRLPTSLNMQFDYNFENDIRVGAIANIGFPANNAFGVERPTYAAVIPRYERLYFEAALPVSINTMFMNPRVGLMLRWGPVTVGTDNIIPFAFNSDIYGADFYFTVRILRFNSPECIRKGVDWRVNDCTAPSNRWSSRDKKGNNKRRYQRNKKRQKRYL